MEKPCVQEKQVVYLNVTQESSLSNFQTQVKALYRSGMGQFLSSIYAVQHYSCLIAHKNTLRFEKYNQEDSTNMIEFWANILNKDSGLGLWYNPGFLSCKPQVLIQPLRKYIYFF